MSLNFVRSVRNSRSDRVPEKSKNACCTVSGSLCGQNSIPAISVEIRIGFQ